MTSAQLLQCPDCLHRHDLSALGAVETFACAGCARPLKVPAVLRAQVGGSVPTVETFTPISTPPRDDVTQVLPPPNPGRVAAQTAAVGPVRVRLWLRLVVWIFAVPIGMFVVFGLAKTMGFITFDQLLDTFANSGWDRFAPIAKILPFAALVIAAIVQAAVAALERRERNIRAALAATANSGPDRLETRNVRQR